jgi:tetratricopeptide (TPR) repeat protein
VERCLERDPARRPASAAEVLAELRDLRQAWDGRRRRRLLGGVAGLALAAIALAGWQWWAREASPGERLATIVADVENGSGAAGLDGMTALLTAALAPSGRLDLLPRERLRRSARQAGLAEMTRLDGAAARTLARLEGAQVLLLPAARRDASGLRLEVRGLDPASGRTLLAVSEEAPSPAEVAPALDRLAEAVRRALHERAADLASGRSRVATALSADLGATQAYFEGLDCQARSWSTPNIGPQSCSRHFERALSIDPSFVAAHLQLAALGVHWRSLDEAKSHVRAVLGAVDRLPPVQALLLRALSAQLEERFAEAAAGYDAVLARAPEDVPALVLAAELRQFQGDYAGQLPYLERRLALDPLAEDPLLSLVWGYLRLGRIQELRALAERQAALPPTAQRVQALAWALQWLGRPAEAVAAAARARAASPGPAMTLVEAKARYATGDAAGAEPLCRVVVAAEPEDPSSWWCVARSLGMQGRFSEALAKIDEARNLSEREGHAAHAGVRAELSAGLGRPEALWADASRAAALDPNNADLALLLALGGDLAHAAEIARRADPSTLVPEEFEALQAWRQGDRAGALARLARAEQRDPIAMEGGIEPSYLIAVVAGADLPRETLAAVDRTRRLYCSAAYRSWTLPHCHLLAARAHLALGDRAAARAEVDALLKGWARADADLPLLREARALAATLR